MNPTTFSCFLVEKDAAGEVRGSLARRTTADLPPGEVLVRVQLSSLNYKDALASQAHPGVVRKLPHVPGIDAAGTVAESTDPRYQPGQPVVITGYELGAGQWGGWAEYVRVPAEWVVPLPDGLSLKETMILGTAGFTAAQCVHAIELNGVKPSDGEIVVTGSTGGVGCIAVRLLAKLGYSVVAVTGKKELEPRLKEWGATRVASRSDVTSDSPKPMLGARWAGAVDTVGGDTLATIIRQTKNYGVVSACGLVGGTDLSLTVHPFILRGITLAGISSSALSGDRRLEIWRKLAGPWRLDGLEAMATTIGLAQIEQYVEKNLAGRGCWPNRSRTLMYEHFDHTADLGLRVRAATLEELLSEAGRGLLAMLVANPESVKPVQPKTIAITADVPELLLFDWLSELLYAFESEKLLLAEFDIHLVGQDSSCGPADTNAAGQVLPYCLSATCRGEPMDPTRHEMDHEVKAITYHGLHVNQQPDGTWFAEAIVDI